MNQSRVESLRTLGLAARARAGRNGWTRAAVVGHPYVHMSSFSSLPEPPPRVLETTHDGEKGRGRLFATLQVWQCPTGGKTPGSWLTTVKLTFISAHTKPPAGHLSDLLLEKKNKPKTFSGLQITPACC